jgi:flagellar hook protein FlgE
MISSLFAGISGLNANSYAMTVIGDNIANVNTVAFKSNSTSFANILSTSLDGSIGGGVGRGTELWGINPSWSQGSLETTNNPTDLAISGKGFFMVNDDSGTTYYTRAGQFNFDNLGYLINPDGLRLQGYQIDSNGNLGSLTDIYIPGERTTPPSTTTEFSFDTNLDASANIGDTYITSQTIYDSLGNTIELTLTYTNTGPGQWDCAASIPASAGGPVTINGAASIPITFDANGDLTSPAADATLNITLTNGANSPQTVTWDLYDALGNSLGDITGYASASATTFQFQDGYAAGILQGISVDEDGMITALYSNGQLIPEYQIALADFPSYYGLAKMGNNLYSESLASGQALVGVAGAGRLGSISPGTIEMSNVDLSQEFVKMITTQRAFQANSRVITASDELLAELINIKR